ncbi:MAG: hypothetical protein K8I29_02475 [Alphaproteobacteria bacterium]|uniref:histidine kinase n=1 Tax=Candidatus Nitrobium versatile TaxID=2884831 RepID=A0A953J3U6_9BACT|nr:hypothetical protein [Candidatus Nitrobium versatile]
MRKEADSLFANIVYRLDYPDDRIIRARRKLYWLSAVTLSVVFLISLPIQSLKSRNIHWIDTFNHSLLESYCGIISFIIAYIIYREYKASGKRSSLYFFLGFFSMGVYDFFHSYSNYCLDLFVWFHSLSAFSGASFLLLGALSSRDGSAGDPPWLRRFFVLFGAAAATLSAAIISKLSPPFPNAVTLGAYRHLPADLPVVGEFSASTIVFNVISAVCFLASGILFLRRFRETNDVLFHVFSLSAFLFFESEFLFAFSKLWDISWWYWHVIKLIIFTGLVIGLAHGFSRTFRELQESREKLTGTVDKLKRAYEDLTNTQEELLESEKLASIGRMAATVAHEIRNPLGAINNAIGIFKRHKQLADDDKELMDIIGEEIRRLNRTITDFLDFARPAPHEKTYANLNSLIEETLALLTNGNGVHHSPVRITKYFDHDLPEIFMDRDAMKQCLWNVLINAIQAMHGGGTLIVTTRYAIEIRNSEPFPEASIVISDNGVGMPEETVSRAFQPFFSTKAKGTGLGLSIVQKIVHSHGGHISISSRQGEGTRVEISLPVHCPEAASAKGEK